MGKLGFDRLLFTLLTDHRTIARKVGSTIAVNYPQTWLEQYAANNYKAIDPVYNYMFTTKGAFTWDSLRDPKKIALPQMALLNMARQAGLNSGVGIPLRGPSGDLAAVMAACSIPRIFWSSEALDYATLLCEQLYKIYLRLERKAEVVQIIRLTDKERQVLILCARGKSQVEIAAVMRVTTHAVKFHLRGILQKLEAANQEVAVMKATAMGLIS